MAGATHECSGDLGLPTYEHLSVIQSQTDLGVFPAALAISTLSPVVFFLIFQRLFLSGAGLGGAVKG